MLGEHLQASHIELCAQYLLGAIDLYGWGLALSTRTCVFATLLRRLSAMMPMLFDEMLAYLSANRCQAHYNTNGVIRNEEIDFMKSGTIYFGMVAVLILLVVGIAIYTFGGFQMFLGDLDLIVIAGLVILYILLGKDPSLQPKRMGTEPPGMTFS